MDVAMADPALVFLRRDADFPFFRLGTATDPTPA